MCGPPQLSSSGNCLGIEVSLLLCVLLREAIYAASSSHPHFAPRWALGIFLADTAAAIYQCRVNEEGETVKGLSP